MAVRNFNEETLTAEVLRRIEGTPNPRLKEVMTSFIKHLHSFVREVRPTPDEWLTGIQFLTETGHWSDDKRQEFILMSDTLGVSMLVDFLNYQARAGMTESTVQGPFHRPNAPEYALGANVAKDPPDGEPCVVRGTIRSADGKPVAGAALDIWETGDHGYDVQKGDAMDLRGIFRTDAEGKFWFRCVKPVSYPVPADGPVGKMLTATGRHPMRPAHLHFMISAPGYERLVTHIFVKGDKYLDSDAVFGVKESLIVDFKKNAAGEWEVSYDFVLKPSKQAKMAA
ncbi:MAG: intradiol ring-cleavage dioxygenase [Pseudomonadota bacterium]